MPKSKKNTSSKSSKQSRKDYIKSIQDSKKLKEKNKKKAKKKPIKKSAALDNNDPVKVKENSNYRVEGIKGLSVTALVFAILGLLICLLIFFGTFLFIDIVDSAGGFENVVQTMMDDDPIRASNLNDTVSDFNYLVMGNMTTQQIGGSIFAALLGVCLIFGTTAFIFNAICTALTIVLIRRCRRNIKVEKSFMLSIFASVFSLLSLNIVNLILFIITAVKVKLYKKFLRLHNI